MTKIKICGLTREADIEMANRYRPDYIGFVFAKSKRMVTDETAYLLKKKLHPNVKSVGVFVDEDPDIICNLAEKKVIDLIQLHGNEDACYMERLKQRISCKIIKAVRVQSTESILQASKLSADYLLLDTYSKGVQGGSGKTFDWSLIPVMEKPYFLAGGLDADNIEKAQRVCHPYCMDVSSGVETNGKKDEEKVMSLIHKVRREQKDESYTQ